MDATFQGKEHSLICILEFINGNMFKTPESRLKLREVDKKAKPNSENLSTALAFSYCCKILW